MITHPYSDDPHQDAEAVRAFFDQWELYRRVRAADCLHHRAAYAALRAALAERREAFSFLDLGAGDAESSTAALAGLPVREYVAVDLSRVALEAAGRNAARLGATVRVEAGNFEEFVRGTRETFDVILIGLSLHHLPAGDKRAFMPVLRERLRPCASLFFYEPIAAEGESRDAVLARWWDVVEATWTALSPEDRERVRAHVFASDYPETAADYAAWTRAAGFSGLAVRFQDAEGLYALFEARA